MIPNAKKREILEDMLKSSRVAGTFMELERKYDNLSVDELLRLVGFDTDTSELYKNRIKGYIDGDNFSSSFYTDLKSRLGAVSGKFTKYKNIRDNADAFDDIIVDECFDRENTLNALRLNRNVNYVMPEGYSVADLDFSKLKLQFFKGLITNDGRMVPYILEYAYVCESCGELVRSCKEMVSLKCPRCRGNLVISEVDSLVKPMNVCKIMIGDASRDCVSLHKLPQGYIDIAGIPTIDDNDFGLFGLSCYKPARIPINFKFTNGRDRLLQMIDIIDKHHESVIGKHVVGLDHFKMAMILARFGTACNDPTMNVLVVGDPGTGKTYTSRLYSYSLTEYAKVQEMTRLSIPGFLGSADEMKFFGQRINVIQPGIIERNDMVVLDEFFDKTNTELNKMKTSLSEATINSEMHGNRRSVRKRASVIGTANISNFHLRRVVERQLSALGDMGAMNVDTIKNMSNSLKDEYTIEGLNWRDGESLALMDRFPIIFYMESDNKSADDIDKNLLCGDDDRMDDTVMHDIVYIKELDNYIKECSEIEFKIDDFHVEAVKTIIRMYFKEKGDHDFEYGDNIHSRQRFRRFIDKLLRYHSMLNMRDRTTQETLDWLIKFYKYTCNFFPVSRLVWDEADKKEDKKEDVSVDDDAIKSVENYAITTREFSLDKCISAMSMSGISSTDVKKALDVLVDYGKLVFVPPTEYKVV